MKKLGAMTRKNKRAWGNSIKVFARDERDVYGFKHNKSKYNKFLNVNGLKTKKENNLL